MTNSGSIGAREVHIDLRFKSKEARFLLSTEPLKRPSEQYFGITHSIQPPNEFIAAFDLEWSTQLEFAALQPKRELTAGETFELAVESSCDIEVLGTVYADTLSEPVVKQLVIHVQVKPFEMNAEKILELARVRIEKSEAAGETQTVAPEEIKAKPGRSDRPLRRRLNESSANGSTGAVDEDPKVE